MNVLIERLQEAIDEAISGSDRINAIVDEMKMSGYDVCLIVESSAAISPIEAVSPAEAISPTGDKQPPDSVPDPRLASTGDIELTAEDLAFLQELSISPNA